MRQSVSLVQTGCCQRRPRRGRPRPDFASVATALAANTTIAAAKGTAAAVTGSPALLAAVGMFVVGGTLSVWKGERAHRGTLARRPLAATG
jgi:hypothetical protein